MFHIVAVNLYGDAIATETISLPYKNSDAYYNELAENVEQFISNHQYPSEKIKGISIATQGIISPDGTSVTYGAIMGNTHMQLSDFSSQTAISMPSGTRFQISCRTGIVESSAI